jgi:hypothetical protein
MVLGTFLAFMEETLDIVSSCQRSLAPLRKYEDNIVHKLNRINTNDSSECREFWGHLEELWSSRRATLNNAMQALHIEEQKMATDASDNDQASFLRRTVNGVLGLGLGLSPFHRKTGFDLNILSRRLFGPEAPPFGKTNASTPSDILPKCHTQISLFSNE